MNLPWRKRVPPAPERQFASLISFTRADGAPSAEYLVMGATPAVTVPVGFSGIRIRSAPVWPQDYPWAEEPGIGCGGGGGTGPVRGGVDPKPGMAWSGTVGKSR